MNDLVGRPAEMPSSIPRHVRWAAQLRHVREVSLLGSAELEPWSRFLAREGWQPIARNGRATLMVVSAQGRFWGRTFRELSISIEVAGNQSSSVSTWFLVEAFNSVWFFALCEQHLFKTPYVHAQVDSRCAEPFEMSVERGGVRQLWARAAAGADRAELPAAQGRCEVVELQVRLPSRTSAGSGRSRYFWARIAGQTEYRDFQSTCDTWEVVPDGADERLKLLVESGFRPQQWMIRRDGQHAKSKTYVEA